jgi:hypothetical protein
MVDFAPGEVLVITGSTAGATYEEVIVEANIDGYTINITTSFEFAHVSEMISIENRLIDLRCEVALLSRNVIIQGMLEMISHLIEQFG